VRCGKNNIWLGFGTTSLLALVNEEERQSLLCAALDAGITHFDTAPYYGYGEAEKVLGRFIKHRRGQVTVTTKFGIQPPKLAAGGTLAGAVKRVVKNFGPLRSLLAKQAGKLVQRGVFGVEDARKSLESSLRSLQTDHIDIFLLHEAGAGDAGEDLRAFLEAKQKEGVIGSFGVGSVFPEVSEIASCRPGFCGVLQFENNVLNPNIQSLPQTNASGSFLVTHGALGGALRKLSSLFAEEAELAGRCSEALGADVRDPMILANAMMAWAARSNPQGAVLFSSKQPGHIRSAVDAVSSPAFTEVQLGQFADLVQMQTAPKDRLPL